MTASPHVRPATAITTVWAVDDLLELLPEPTGGVAFVTNRDGLVGWGEHARFTTTGPDAAAQIGTWFDDVLDNLEVHSGVDLPGTGPIVFVSLGFDENDESVAVVPSVVLGRRGSLGFRTVIGSGDPVRSARPVTAPGRISWSDADMSVPAYTAAVTEAVRRIRDGRLEKVVLAHDLVATAENLVDERHLAARLAASYPSCSVFAVDGLVGASPELMVRRTGNRITSRVLAGTAWADGGDDRVADGLLSSPKDLAEHDFAVRSAVESLQGVTATLSVPDHPHPLRLANLTHLASDLVGTLADSTCTALDVAATLHPTAAVGGTPTTTARTLIAELEPVRRGRYAAPVGWLDARGDGEFAIALRCAEIDGHRVRLVAGCGIVADSDPETEAREAQVKMIPVRDALES